MKLINLLNLRKEVAEKFTEDFHSRVKRDLKVYNAEQPSALDSLNIDLVDIPNKRYQFTIPLVFTDHEAMLASMFDRIPELIFSKGGKHDEEKALKVQASYEYLQDKLDLEMVLTDVAWWFILSGFAASHTSYQVISKDVPIYDEMGEPMLDEMGEVLTRTDFEYDDPIVEVGDPVKDYWSPESEFCFDGKKIPYYIRFKKLTVQEVKEKYNKDVEPDTSLEKVGETKEDVKSDTERVGTWFYSGTLPKEVSGQVKGWTADQIYYIVFTTKEVLYKKTIEEHVKLNESLCRVVKWLGQPNEFFGFGLAKLLAPFQREKSIRRGQMIRYADIAAFPKVLAEEGSKLDNASFNDPRENRVILYSGQKPEYLQPPQISQIVGDTNELADRDAQSVSGLLDISSGSQSSSVVKTATGQSIFADAAEKRVRKAKRTLMKWYRSQVILLLKLCQANWQSEKLIEITDNDGQTVEVSVSAQDLSDIDFDKDVDIDPESVSINKDVLRAQAIEMYNMTKDDPLVERKESIKHVYQNGFNVTDPERFLKDQQLVPGTQLVDPQSGQNYLVDESGEVVSQDSAENMAQPTGGMPPTSQAGLMGATQ
jgi:hypothetical protein